MGEWREKEWDEPGPDFGKVFYRPAGPLIQRRPKYESASGKRYTYTELYRETLRDAEAGWDEATQGPWPFSFNFKDWLIEAINTGVIKEL